jgi:Zn-finger nucleic acid-binding protein
MVFRDNRHACPRCGSDFEELRTSLGHRFEKCPACHGNWVDAMTLREMFDRMKPGRGVPPFSARTDDDPVLKCPICTAALVKVTLHRLALDRCEDHGVWFDGRELEATLFQYGLA